MNYPTLERWWPHRGPCAFCGGDDARHRQWDVMLGMLDAGDSVEDVAQAYEMPPEAIAELARVRPGAEQGGEW